MDKNIGIDEKGILVFLSSLFEEQITGLDPIEKGNIKSSYFFRCNNTEYVLSLSKKFHKNELNNFITKLLIENNIKTKKVLKSGSYDDYNYTICKKIAGESLDGLDEKRLDVLLPSLVESLTKIHFIDLSKSKGFGWVGLKGNGEYSSWRAYLEDFFSENQKGYWKNWYALFKNSFLDYSMFNDFYETMISLSKYCEDKRYLVHGDFHLENIIGQGNEITGIIDWDNVMYGDFIFDIATLQMQVPDYKIVERFKEYYKLNNIEVPNFDKRFKCLSLCKGLDALRFFSKHGWKKSYDSVLKYLEELIST